MKPHCTYFSNLLEESDATRKLICFSIWPITTDSHLWILKSSSPFFQSQLRHSNVDLEFDLEKTLGKKRSCREKWYSSVLTEIVSALCGDGKDIQLVWSGSDTPPFLAAIFQHCSVVYHRYTQPWSHCNYSTISAIPTVIFVCSCLTLCGGREALTPNLIQFAHSLTTSSFCMPIFCVVSMKKMSEIFLLNLLFPKFCVIVLRPGKWSLTWSPKVKL